MRVALTLLLLLAAVRAEHRGKSIYHAPGALLSPGDDGNEAGVCQLRRFLLACPLPGPLPNCWAGIRERKGKVRDDVSVPGMPLWGDAGGAGRGKVWAGVRSRGRRRGQCCGARLLPSARENEIFCPPSQAPFHCKTYPSDGNDALCHPLLPSQLGRESPTCQKTPLNLSSPIPLHKNGKKCNKLALTAGPAAAAPERKDNCLLPRLPLFSQCYQPCKRPLTLAFPPKQHDLQCNGT